MCICIAGFERAACAGQGARWSAAQICLSVDARGCHAQLSRARAWHVHIFPGISSAVLHLDVAAEIDCAPSV